MPETEFRPGATSSATSTWNRVVLVLLVVVILAALGALGYVMTQHPEEDSYTQFYFLGIEGEAAGYPTELAVGEEGEVFVGVFNHEYETMTYEIEVGIDEVKNGEIGPLVLEHTEKWQEKVSFTPQEAGKDIKVEFFLYKQGQSDIYKSLRLLVDVTGQG